MQAVGPRLDRKGLVEYYDEVGEKVKVTLPDYVVRNETRIDASVEALQSTLATKADTGALNAALHPKASKTDVDAAIALKQDRTLFNEALARKADRQTFLSSISELEDKAAFDEALTMANNRVQPIIDAALAKMLVLEQRIGVGLENPRFTGDEQVADPSYNTDYGWDTKDGWRVSGATYRSDLQEWRTTPDAWRAFNKTNMDMNDAWISEVSTNQFGPLPIQFAELQIEYPKPVSVMSYSITSRNSSGWPNYTLYPTRWRLEGSNDGSNWLMLHERSNINSWLPNETKIFELHVARLYSKFRLLITGARTQDAASTLYPHSASAVAIGQWRLNPPSYVPYEPQ